MRRSAPKILYPALIAGWVALTGIALSFVIARMTSGWQEYRYQRELATIGDNCVASLHSDIEYIETSVHAIRNFFISSTEVTRDEFSTFVQPFLKTGTGLRALGWIPRVPVGELMAFRNRYLTDTPPPDTTGTPPAAPGRTGFSAFAFLEPPLGREKGISINVDDIIAQSPPKAVQDSSSGIVTLRAPDELLENSTDAMMVLAVGRDWRQRTPPDTNAGTRPPSYAAGLVSVNELLAGIITKLNLDSINIELQLRSAASTTSPGTLICAYRYPPGLDTSSSADTPRFRCHRAIETGGGQWLLTILPTKSFMHDYRFFNPMLIFFIGVVITLLIALNLLFLLRKNSRIQFLVEQRTRELAASEHRLSIIADNIEEGFWLYSVKEDRFTYISTGLVKIMGEKGNRIIGGPFESCLANVHPDDATMVAATKRSGFREGKPFHLEYRMLAADNSVVWIAEYANPLDTPAGDTPLFAGVCSDITRRKSEAAEKKQLEERFFQAQKAEAIGHLAGCIAHDFNNLLTPVIAFGEMLQEDLKPDTQAVEYINQMVGAGLRAKDLVGQLLAFSRKQKLEYKIADLDTIIRNFEPLIRKSIRENITLTMKQSEEVKYVTADVGQIEQVIMNIVVNAADAMRQGGRLTIETEITMLDERAVPLKMDVKPGAYATLIITDTGHGMDKATSEKIFEPFFSTKGPRGTGLGLASVYGIIKQHGGNISVYSEPGSGTSFKLYLPITSDQPVADVTPPPKKTPDRHRDISILVVDDNAETLQLVAAILKREHYSFHTVASPAEAIEIVNNAAEKFDLLITDIIMPDMNGVQLYGILRQRLPFCKVLYMSGYPDSVTLDIDPTDAAARYIRKPFSMKEFIAAVQGMATPS